MEKEPSNREKSEANILLWSTVIGGPFGLSIAIFSWANLPWKLYLPVSILIGFVSGLITYLKFIRGDIKDFKRKTDDLEKLIKKLKTENKKLKSKITHDEKEK